MMEFSLAPNTAKQSVTKKSDVLKLRRVRVASYLYQLAEAVKNGEVASFAVHWEEDMDDLAVDLHRVYGVNSDP